MIRKPGDLPDRLVDFPSIKRGPLFGQLFLDQSQINLIVELGTDASLQSITDTVSGVRSFRVDSFFDITYVSNIGSSGEDGVRFIAPPSFDVFFEIDLTVDSAPAGTIPTEMVALSLGVTLADPTNPGASLDAVRDAINATGNTVYYVGHVTLIR